MRSRCEWPGEERDELVGDSTRFDGCEDKLSSEKRAYSSKARREEWRARERAGPDAANDDETAGSLGRWKGGRKTQRSSASEQPARANGGGAGQGRAIGRSLADPQWKGWKDSGPKPCLETRRWAVVIDCPVPNA
jgi:hypothetical protein